jgi:hypothetical protein
MLVELNNLEIDQVCGGDAGGYDAYGGIDWGAVGIDMNYAMYQRYLSWQAAHPNLTYYDWPGGGGALP